MLIFSKQYKLYITYWIINDAESANLEISAFACF